jgi:RNA polymerase sigma-70 factor, ECF subfamily
MAQPALAEHIAALRRYARALLGDRIDADDLVQDCLARALSRAHLWRPDSNLRAWLFTILHNIHINNLRSRQAFVAAASVEYSRRGGAGGAAPDARLELRDLERALLALPDEQRQVLLLIGLEGMSYGEAAAIVGVPIGTIMSRMARGRDALRRQLTFAEPGFAAVALGGVRHLRQVK